MTTHHAEALYLNGRRVQRGGTLYMEDAVPLGYFLVLIYFVSLSVRCLRIRCRTGSLFGIFWGRIVLHFEYVC